MLIFAQIFLNSLIFLYDGKLERGFLLKVLVPVAGRGVRLRPHTNTRPKGLVSVANKPILGHILDDLGVLDNVEELIIVGGYMFDLLRDFVVRNYSDIFPKISFVLQEPRLGLAHAVYVAREHFKGSSLLITLGDMIFERVYQQMLEDHRRNEECDGSIAVKEIDDPSSYGIVWVGEESVIRRLVEKPKHSDSRLGIAGAYFIESTDLLVECIEELMSRELALEKEYQLTDALDLMCNKGACLKTIDAGEWYDCGRKDTLLEANRVLLRGMTVNGKSEVLGELIGVRIIPPVAVSEGCVIDSSIIGPFVSVGEGCKISNSIISDSIISQNSFIENIILNKAVIGDEVVIKGKAYSLNVGDNSTVMLE